jgi:molecular chaperone GrpE
MIYSAQLHSGATDKEQEYLAGWQRARAELDNFRKRVLADREQERRRVKQEVIESLLTLADNFQALVRHIPEDRQDDTWVQGVIHITRQFDQVMQEYGIKQINPQGKPFDPTVHEAVAQVKQPGQRSGLIVEVLQPGYQLGGAVIRPAKVKVTA